MRAWVLGGLGLATLAAAQLDTKPIEVSQNYRGPEGSIELEGVCKIDETSVNCWKADGKPHDELKARVITQLTSENPSVTAHFGKKTRHAIFRFSGAEDLHAISFAGSTWELGRRSSSSSRSIVVPIVTSLEQRKATVDVSVRASGTSSSIQIKEGATLDYRGGRLRIVKVSLSELDPAVFGTDVLSRWLVYISTEGAPLNYATWSAYDEADLLISAVNLEGKPVKVDPAALQQMDALNTTGTGPKPDVRRAHINAEFITSPGGQLPVQQLLVINIDPKFIKHVTLRTQASRKITINDIPLEGSR